MKFSHCTVLIFGVNQDASMYLFYSKLNCHVTFILSLNSLNGELLDVAILSIP